MEINEGFYSMEDFVHFLPAYFVYFYILLFDMMEYSLLIYNKYKMWEKILLIDVFFFFFFFYNINSSYCLS